MSVYEVPEPAWSRFCERFSREHRGKRVTVARTRNPDDVGAEREIVAAGRRLGQVMVKEAARRVVVMLEDGGPDRVVVTEPKRLRFEQHGEDGHALLRIDAAGAPSVLLCFDGPLVPGILNGWP